MNFKLEEIFPGKVVNKAHAWNHTCTVRKQARYRE